MSIINSILQRKAGLPSSHVELQHQALTKGHAACEGGLRGHSVGSTYPYRVVGKGDGTWEVHRNGSAQAITGCTCEEAHDFANECAEQLRQRAALRSRLLNQPLFDAAQI